MTERTEPTGGTRWLSSTELDAWMPFSGMLLSVVSALDAQLQRDAKLSLFGYLVMAGLSDAPDRTLPMSDLAVLANGSLSRLSHAVTVLEKRGWVRRGPCPGNRRVTVASLTDDGHAKLVATAPGHVDTVRRLVLDAIGPEQLQDLGRISEAIVASVGPPCPPRPAARSTPAGPAPAARRQASR
ncbi:MarR family winged helix-turn-helix transcriptional regulator [Actinacidiphila sp. ITFR-21]|uniref:MarR family winged helix-turn-helix transcriptional regulator n=1 Tax=Actinacidiphila sp. ITFR-21 TaxID=3075199 RepID=UPI00288C3027|nr:MarR family transcriptional regulator [Streptomyces sp. ITFR-21]WNI18903.1 MarR family transcriptional regulator [Streptomyces sp. ITFR-21]